MSKAAQPTPREIRQKSGKNQSAFWGPLGVTQSGGRLLDGMLHDAFPAVAQ